MGLWGGTVNLSGLCNASGNPLGVAQEFFRENLHSGKKTTLNVGDSTPQAGAVERNKTGKWRSQLKASIPLFPVSSRCQEQVQPAAPTFPP